MLDRIIIGIAIFFGLLFVAERLGLTASRGTRIVPHNVFGSGHVDGETRAQSGVLEPGYYCNCSQARVEAPADFVNR